MKPRAVDRDDLGNALVHFRTAIDDLYDLRWLPRYICLSRRPPLAIRVDNLEALRQTRRHNVREKCAPFVVRHPPCPRRLPEKQAHLDVLGTAEPTGH